MSLKQFGIYLLTAVSVALFIRVSIVPFFAVYGDPLDEMFMSGFSLAFLSAAFALTVRRGSFIVGSVMALIGAFYIYNGNRILGLITEAIARDPNSQGMIYANIVTIIVGAAILSCGIFAILLRRRAIEKRDANVMASV